MTIWGLIGVYGLDGDNVKCALFGCFIWELVTSMSIWDIPWCLGGNFNVMFPSERSAGGKMTFAMIEFSLTPLIRAISY